MIGLEALCDDRSARGPADLDRIDDAGLAQPEVQPRVGGGLIAAGTDPLGYEPPASRDDRHSRPKEIKDNLDLERRKARLKKERPILLAELERRYLEAPVF